MAGDEPAKPTFSSRLMQMKFMQRAAERKSLKKRKAEQQQEGDGDGSSDAAAGTSGSGTASWAGQVAKGCRVIVEGDPLPTAVISGRMSFRSFNPATEKLQQELAGGGGDSDGKQGEDADGITDEEFAERYSKTTKKKGGKHDDEMLPMRPPKRRKL